VRAEVDEHRAPIVVASVATLARPERLQRVASDFSMVTVDEAHHGAADSYRRLLERMGATDVGGPVAVGGAATPAAADGQRVGGGWQGAGGRLAGDRVPAGDAGDDAGRVSLRFAAVRVELAVDLDQVQVRAGDYAEDGLEEAYRAANAPEHAVDAYLKHADGR